MEKGFELEGTPGYLNVLAFGREAQKIMAPLVKGLEGPGGPPPKGGMEVGAGVPPALLPPAQEDQASLDTPPPPAMDAEPLGLEQLPPEEMGGEPPILQ